MKSLLDITLNELSEFLAGAGEKPYRASQIFDWIYQKGIDKFSGMSNLPKMLRTLLESSFLPNPLKLIDLKTSKDGSIKALLEGTNGMRIESVALTSDVERVTFCISTQAGCPMGCLFCATGKMGFKRNLKAGEMVSEVLHLERNSSRPQNIVLMGMGESLLNLPEVDRFIRIITESKGYALSERRITLSTAGLISELRQFNKLHPKVELAISLNASNDETRKRLMPNPKLSSFSEIINAIPGFDCDITLEYVLLDKINDSRKDAEQLVTAIRKIRNVKVNLIRYNKTGTEFRKPPEEKVLGFQKVLTEAGMKCFIRRSLGAEISGACGQLAACEKAK